MGDSLTGNVGNNKNRADLAKKVLYDGKYRVYVSNLLYVIFDDM